MSKLIYLSYSTLSNFEKSPHSWINRQLGIKQPENIYMTEGKAAHKIFQDHVMNVKKDDRINLDLSFTQAEYNAYYDYNGKYGLYGYIDLINFASKTICEYKTSSSPWSQQKFDDLKQIPLYCLATGFRKAFMVTSTRDLKNFKTFYKEVTEEDIEKVKIWIDSLTTKIEAGEFFTDLIDRKCQGCDYHEKCFFI